MKMYQWIIYCSLVFLTSCGGEDRGSDEGQFEDGTCTPSFEWGYFAVKTTADLLEDAIKNGDKSEIESARRELENSCRNFFKAHRGQYCTHKFIDENNIEKSMNLYASDLKLYCD